MPHLILASTSRFRRALLDRLGLSYTAIAPQFEETPEEGMNPCEVARTFAVGKARSIVADPNAWILGCDQVAELDGRILRKTTNLVECREQLRDLAGKTHCLHSAVALWLPSDRRLLEETVTVKLTMRRLDPGALDRYVALDQPMGSAGGYFFEGRGIALFDEIQGGDDSAIIGLPLMSLCRLMEKAGLEPLSLIS